AMHRGFIITSFNPPPVRRPGGTQRSAVSDRSISCFNPPPVRRPGGTRLLDGVGVGCGGVSIRPRSEDRGEHEKDADYSPIAHVSIRPRSEDRGELGVDPRKAACPSGFNPPPVRRPGGTLTALTKSSHGNLFQSAPGPKTGGNIFKTHDKT